MSWKKCQEGIDFIVLYKVETPREVSVLLIYIPNSMSIDGVRSFTTFSLLLANEVQERLTINSR